MLNKTSCRAKYLFHDYRLRHLFARLYAALNGKCLTRKSCRGDALYCCSPIFFTHISYPSECRDAGRLRSRDDFAIFIIERAAAEDEEELFAQPARNASCRSPYRLLHIVLRRAQRYGIAAGARTAASANAKDTGQAVRRHVVVYGGSIESSARLFISQGAAMTFMTPARCTMVVVQPLPLKTRPKYCARYVNAYL